MEAEFAAEPLSTGTKLHRILPDSFGIEGQNSYGHPKHRSVKVLRERRFSTESHRSGRFAKLALSTNAVAEKSISGSARQRKE
jgi:hypothetical protein